MKKILFSVLVLLSSTILQAGGAPFVTVGADDDDACNYHSIQAAIDGNLSNVIRIASNKNYFESILIDGFSVELIGGYEDCTQAESNFTNSSRANITGNGSEPAIEFVKTNNNDIDEVILRNLVFANGNPGLYVTAQNMGESLLLIDNVRLFNNDYGLHVFAFNGGMPKVNVRDSLIDFNEDSGVYCTGDGAKVRFGGDSIIEENEAEQRGGGLHIQNDCEVEIFSPTVIRNNKAISGGGGMYVTNASVTVNGIFVPDCENNVCFGDWESPVLFEGNEANSDGLGVGDGGAIDVVGSDGSVVILNSSFVGNSARYGGALSASAEGEISALGFQSDDDDCWSPGTCLQFKQNQADAAGVLFSQNLGSSIFVTGAEMSHNTSQDGVIGRVQSDGKFSIVNTYIHHNGYEFGKLTSKDLFDISQFNGTTETEIILEGVTIADNFITQQVFDNDDGNLSVRSSLVFDQQDVYSESGSNPSSQFECVIAHENNSFLAGGTVFVIDRQLQPVFANPQSFNYRLRFDSPAIDYCYGFQDTLTVGDDADNDDRGVDNPEEADLFGVYDIGADEFNINNDIIFKNGFEQE